MMMQETPPTPTEKTKSAAVSPRSRLRASWRLARAVWGLASDNHIGLIAAGVAFFGLFGIFPGIAAVIAIFGLLADPLVVAQQLMLLEDIIPQDAYNLIAAQVYRLAAAPNQALGWTTALSILLALWACRAGVAALIGGLQAIAGQRSRSGLRQAFVAMLLTLALVALAVVALIVVIIMPVVLAIFPLEIFPLAGAAGWLLEALRWALALFVLITGLGLLYRFGPARTTGRFRWVSVGAVLVIVLWVAASAGLSAYLTHFGNYNEVYGSLGAVIGLLLWLYLSAYLILLGAALNVLVEGRASDRQAG